MIGGTIIVILLVLVFIFTFVIPVAQSKYAESSEGFSNMSNYRLERNTMRNEGSQLYNQLGSAMDPILPNFAVTDVAYDPNLTNQQFAQKFNTATQQKNKDLTVALQTPDGSPSMLSPTNMAIVSQNVNPQLPPANDLYLTALRCQASLTKRLDCSKLDDPKNALCGICIKGGTKFDGSSPKTFIGGLLSIFQDRTDAEDAAAGGTPLYQPSLGKCPPGMFYVDSASCIKAVNQLECTEIGETGGFQGGRTIEGRTLNDVSCAQAPVAGTNTYVYKPTDEKTAPYPVVLRVISPFGTGITQIVVTHQRSGKTYTASNDGNPGQEFTLTLPSVMEADTVNVLVVQEMPNRTKGQSEVFQVQEQVQNGQMNTYNVTSAKALCNRIGSDLATSAQLKNALDNGLQSPNCGIVSDQTTPMYAAQTGSSSFKFIPIGGAPGMGVCQNSGSANSAWCFGFKPSATITNPTIPSPIRTSVVNWFNSFGPPQAPSLYSKFSEPGASDPPGNSERAVIIQWEMKDSNDRTVPFLQTISRINGNLAKPAPPTPSPLRLLGPFTGSSVISGPVWQSRMSILKNQFWFWSNSSNSPTVTFVAQVPGYLENPYYSDDLEIAPMGPLITKESTNALLKSSPCMVAGQNPGSYSAACLLDLFQGVGGVPGMGTLSTKNGGLTQLNGYGDLNAISTYLRGLYRSATAGKDANGNLLSQDLRTRMNAMNAAAQLLFGFDIVNPCEQIVDNADGSVGLIATPMINVTPQCLQYLWLNTGSDGNRRGSAGVGRIFDGTYTNIADRFSGLMNTESTPDRRGQYPFQACQLSGTMAPIKNGRPDRSVVNQLMEMPSLQAIQNYFDGIFKTANNLGGTFGNSTAAQSADQAAAIQQCYGINQIKGTAVGNGCTDWTPLTIPGIELWLDGNDPLGTGNPPADQTPIPTWRDKSGKGRNATAPNDVPIFNTNVWNRNGSILLNPNQVSQSKQGNYVLPPFNPASSASQTPGSPTIFIVVSVKTYTANNGAYMDCMSPPNWRFFYLNDSVQGGGAGTINLTNGYTDAWNILTPAGTANRAPQVLTLQIADPRSKTAPTSRTTVYVNGNRWMSPVYGDGVPCESYWAEPYDGKTRQGFMNGNNLQFAIGRGLVGYVSELVMFNRQLNDKERQQVEGYLAWKWGQQDSLPVKHLYGSRMP